MIPEKFYIQYEIIINHLERLNELDKIFKKLIFENNSDSCISFTFELIDVAITGLASQYNLNIDLLNEHIFEKTIDLQYVFDNKN